MELENKSSFQTLRDFEAFVDSRCRVMANAIEDKVHAAVGISGEAGELIDAIKKEWVYGKSADRNNVIEEMGDIMYYLQRMANMYSVTLEDILESNMEKLRKRYPDGYSDAAAIARADKKPGD